MTENLIKALAKALPEVEGASKDKTNPHFKAKYADLCSVIEAIRPVAKHGLWFRQAPIENEKGACIETFYVHESGEQMSAGQCFVPASKNDAQGFGSAMTYCRRYGLLAAFGIAPEDDDGNAAATAPQKQIDAKPAKCSAADVERITELAKAADKSIGAITDAYIVKQLRDLDVNQAEAVIKRLKDTIDKNNIVDANNIATKGTI